MSNHHRTFRVFGEPVEVLVPSEDTHGSFSMIVQTSPPGGGPPPHQHENEDEIFRVLEGEFELFDGCEWRKMPKDEDIYTLRGSMHTFRNCGTGPGRIQCIIVPGGLERYLEELSAYEMPQDANEVLRISAHYGISFLAKPVTEITPI